MSIGIRPGIWRVVLVIVAWSGGVSAAEQAADPDAVAAFENEVRPLLTARCVKCHGPKKQESGLRLDGRDAALRGGDGGPALVPGKPDESLLVKAVRHEDDLQMPPGVRLKDEQIAALTRWISRGAAWPDDAKGVAARRGGVTPEDRAFWSFRPVVVQPAPAVRDREWLRTAVDPWVLAALEARGLKPVGPADRRTLIRRATFDLTGLPPTPEEVDDFAADAAADAFARVVDRLLASPAYGERWGRHWLDLVRYADTAGETADYPVREAYRYRDYVVAAFNRDIPYDEFVRDQVAGDVLAGSGPRDAYAGRVTATGFLAISRRFGFDSENYQHLTIQDTIDTTGQTFLGLTIGCARCHDHKYDPISARDYYALYGIFESTRYPFPGSEQKPNLRAMASLSPPAETEASRQAFSREFAAVEGALEALKAGRPAIKLRTLDDMDGDFEVQGQSSGGSLGYLVAPWMFEGRPEVTPRAQSPFTNLTHRAGSVGITFPGDAGDHRIGQAMHPARTAKTHDRLFLNLDFRLARPTAVAPGSYRISLGHGPGRSPAVEVSIRGKAVRVRDGDHHDTVRPLKSDTWYNLQLAIDLKTRTYSGAVGVPGDLSAFSDKAFAPGWDGTIDDLLVDGRGDSEGVRPALDLDNLVVRDAAFPPVSLPAVPKAPDTATAKDAVALAARRHAELVERGPSDRAYAVAEGTPHDARIQKRGEPGKPGDVVPRRFLEVLGGDPLPPGAAGSGRLQLAQWLTRPGNPLTARVMVNRIWKDHFGNGLVATENDFGRRGKAPTHPGLLDDLAHRFTAGGWSVKAIHRLIMLSATYQLSGDHEPKAAAVDPGAEMLWRFPRQRLDAEAIRDTMLALGSGLDRSPGGPHPFPPVGVAFTQHNPFDALYETDRRSIYLMTQRSKRHPYLALFDGADPNSGTAKRAVTTVPTQALFFMNDPFVHDRAAGFARRLTAEQPDDAGRVRLAYRLAMAREPRVEEFARASEFLGQYRQRLRDSGAPPDRQEALCWAAFARTLFASNEFLFID